MTNSCVFEAPEALRIRVRVVGSKRWGHSQGLVSQWKETDAVKEKVVCVACGYCVHSPAIKSLPSIPFVCNYCLERHGESVLGLFVQLFDVTVCVEGEL